ncbi:ABC transporter permease [Ochrobactrum sp. EDr1-4]|uniref:ABC transporter permease n=1 Tax=Ochrobactrum sp. EDr1-4 TaxID=3368622 RepID=UPI003B9FCB3C
MTVVQSNTQEDVLFNKGSWRTPRSARTYSGVSSWLLTMPLLFFLTVGFIYPIVTLIKLSFSKGFLATYGRIFVEPLYLSVLFSTVTVALIVTIAGVLLGYPVAFAMARLNKRWAFVVAACVFIPLWTSILIRSYAWIVLLQRNGLVNSLLKTTGLADQPVKMLYTQGAVILAMTHVLLPFVILPIFSVLRTVPNDYVRAARNLGAGAVSTFLRITLPLSLPGVFAGATICFVLALGFYITPALVGGPGSMLMPTLIAQQTTVVVDWPFAAALSTVLLVMTLVFIALFRKGLSFQKGFSNVR